MNTPQAYPLQWPANFPRQSGAREKPILFSSPMVRAILDGRKTQTRRMVKRLQIGCLSVDCPADRISFVDRCPYGQPGDRLWVKETHRFDGLDPKIALRSQCLDEISYRADMQGDRACDDCAWRPSIFMPRWGSRITLEITGVRVERLNEISILDSHAEGVGGTYGETGISLGFTGLNHEWDNKTAVEQYQWLWESINGPGSWDLNPWVWVVEFKRLEVAR